MDNLFLVVKDLKYSLKHLIKASRRMVVADIAVAIVKVLEFFYINVIVLRKILDLLSGGYDASSILSLILSAAIVRSFRIIFVSYYDNVLSPAEASIVENYFSKVLHKKANQVDLACYDNSKYFDDFVLSTKNFDKRALKVLNDISTLISTILTVILTTSFALSVDYLLILFIVLPIIGDSVLRIKIGLVESEKEVEIERNLRLHSYINQISNSSKYAKEFRLTNISKLLRRMFNTNTTEIEQIHKRSSRKLLKLYLFSDFLYEPKNILITLYLAYKVIITEEVSPGEFIAIQLALMALSSNLGKINERVMVFSQHSIFIKKFREFIEYQNRIVDGKASLSKIESIEFKDVYFRYDEGLPYVLSGVSFAISDREIFAIVGENGEGKTTILKLLTRFYDANAGEILINGHPIQSYKINDLRGEIQSVMQSFNCYKITIEKNIKAGHIDLNEKCVEEALRLVNLYHDISLLELKEHTPIGKEFFMEGTEFSVGQQQRIAIARSICKDGSIVIMDEPSSALDPYAESRLLNLLETVSDEKIAVIVSHHLSLTKNCDKIGVLSNGKIIELGNHKELLSKNGVYAQMYKAQINMALVN